MSEQKELAVLGRESISESMNRLVSAVHKIDALTLKVKGVQENLRTVFEEAKSLSEQAFGRDELIVQYQRHEQQVIAAYNEMEKQRDAVLDEYSTMLNRLRDGDFFDDALGKEVYSAAMETHNEAFWQSLGYDLAENLGGKWQHMQANLLYELLTEDAEEMAENTGLEVEDIEAFRDLLFDIVDKLYQKAD